MATPTYAQVISQINTFIVTNHNNEITANVLNPILILLSDFTNNTIGDLNALTTDQKNSVVEAINSLKDNFNNLVNNGVQLYTGIPDPNVTPPPSYKAADFYLQIDVNSLPIDLWQFDGFTWVNSTSASVFWGGITGFLSDQTDLQTALDLRELLSNKQNNLNVDGTGIKFPTVDAVTGALSFKVSNIIAGTNISVNSFDPQNPIISAIPSTSAGIFDRVYFTGQVATVATPVGPNYDTIRNGKGSVASVSLISPPIAASSKVFFTNDMIGPAQVVAGSLPTGNFTSFLSVLPSAIAALKRFTIEIFLCDNSGVIIPQSGPPSTDPSVFYAGKNTVVILDSGNLTLPASNSSVGLSGYLNTPLNVAVGQRFRYHISVERGAGGGAQTMNINIGNTWNSYIEAPVPLTTSSVINVSGVIGATDTDALNTLNTGKQNLFTANNILPKGSATGLVNSSIADSGTGPTGRVDINNFIGGTVTRVLPSGQTFVGQTFNITGADNTSGIINRTTFNLNENGFIYGNSNGFVENMVINTKSTNQGSTALLGNNTVILQNGAGTVFNIVPFRSAASGSGIGQVNFVTLYDSYPSPFSNSFNILNFKGLQLQNTPQNGVINSWGVIVGELYGSTISRGIDLGVSAGTGKFNVYAGGTANNYFNGDVLIGTNSNPNSAKLRINGVVDLAVPPTTSAGTYDILTRNITTGVVEKIASSSVVQGSGISGQVTFWNSANTQSGDNGLFWDNVNKRLGVNTITPIGKFNIVTGLSGNSLDMINQQLGSISFGNGSSSTAVPTIIGKSNDSLGLQIQSGTSDSNLVSDMLFNVRTNSNNDFTTLTNIAFRFSRFTTPLVDILRNGNTGFGTFSPLSAVHTVRDGLNIIIQNATNGSTASPVSRRLSWYSTTPDERAYIDVPDARSTVNGVAMIFATKDNTNTLLERMRIDNGGNVGINVVPTSVATDKLQVNGNITANAATAANHVVIKSQLDAATRPYQVYTALLTQSGTSAPVATILENTMGGTLTWAYIGVGTYRVTWSGTVISGAKTAVFITLNSGSAGAGATSGGAHFSGNIFDLVTANGSGTLANGIITGGVYEIRVYP